MKESPDPKKIHEHDTSETDQTSFACNECGSSFQTPILAIVTITDQVRTYQACPRCMAKVHTIKTTRSEDRQDSTTSKKEPVKPTPESTESEACTHSFGYLNKRPKDTPIPEQCLTCNRMINCMAQQ